MEQLSLMDFQDLCYSILSGERSVQDTIDVYNNRRDVLNKLSFLNHLLSYKNIHKDNLLQVLHKIYLMFRNKIIELNQNQNIQKMIERNDKEWYTDKTEITIKDPIYDGFFDHHSECNEKYDESCKICKKIDLLVDNEHNIPLDSNIESSHPLEKDFDEGITSCDESIQYIQEIIMKIENTLIKYFNSFNLYQIIDLSMKHKSLYLSLIEGEDDTIPENIHKVFSNFIYIHNLFYKQVIQYYNYLSTIKQELEKKCIKIKDLKQNLQTIAYIEPKEEIMFYSDDEDNEDNEDDEEEEEEKQLYDKNQFKLKEGIIDLHEEDDDDTSIIDRILKLF